LRAGSPDVARQKLAETVMTLRHIEHIASGGRPANPNEGAQAGS
jgi:hypothetical protein